MYQPTFSITSKILSNLTQIERLYGNIEAEPLVPSLELKLAEKVKVESAHFTTQIEGVHDYDLRQVTNILLGDRTPINKTEQEIRNSFDVLSSIEKTAFQHDMLSVELILDLHARLMNGLPHYQPGQFRDEEVIVGKYRKKGQDTDDTVRADSLVIDNLGHEIEVKHEPPAHDRATITSLIEELVTWNNNNQDIHPVFKSGFFHHQFVHIHPFVEGNGRMARVLASLILTMHGYHVTKYFVMEDYYELNREDYYTTLHEADLKQYEPWLEFYTDGLVYSLIAAQARIDDLKDKSVQDLAGEDSVLLSRREEEVLGIIMEQGKVKAPLLGEQLGVSRQQAHQLLASLVEKGFVKKIGETKGSYYQLEKKN